MKHAPGPWELTRSKRYNSLRIVGADGSPVASFGNQSRWVRGTTLVANARLIAAAPKLLEALEAEQDADTWDAAAQLSAVEMKRARIPIHERWSPQITHPFNDSEQLRALAKKLRQAAIAEATGK